MLLPSCSSGASPYSHPIRILDEPTTGLGPRSRSALWDILRCIVADGTTVLLTTQYLDEADKLADRIAVIDHGRVIAAGTSGELKNSAGSAGVLAAIGLVLLFASALSWAWITLGLVLRSPNAVMSAGFVILFPVTFISNIFVDPATMPGWLREVSDVNPVSHLVTATRALMAGTAATPQVLWAVAAAGVLIALFAPLTVLLYRRK